MFDNFKEYINNRIEYSKLEVVDSVSNMISTAVFSLLIGMFVLLIGLIASLAFGFLLGNWFGNIGLGFLALFGLYILILIVVFITRKRIKLIITDKAVAAAMEALDNSDSKSDGTQED